ncbi:MAG TPA: hypothetical protein VJM74_02220 [Nitrososphaeraceae archaeon]|nr:hypothetical protein [Nitrososphaeraceae archaeon]
MKVDTFLCDQCGNDLLTTTSNRAFISTNLSMNNKSDKKLDFSSFSERNYSSSFHFCDFFCLEGWCESNMKHNNSLKGK